MVEHRTSAEYEPDHPLRRRVFGWMALVVLAVALTGLGLHQLVRQQRDSFEEEVIRPAQELRALRAEQQTALESYATGPDKGTFAIPLDRARQLVLQDPTRLRHTKRGPDFQHPLPPDQGGTP